MSLPPVVFSIFQTGSLANGGVESITQIIERLRRVQPIVVTQLETPANARWLSAGARVEVWPLPFRMGDSFRISEWNARARRVTSLVSTNLRMAQLVRRAAAHVV